MAIRTLFMLFLSSFVCSSDSLDTCNIPSSHWCDTKESALMCNVIEQCQKYAWPMPSMQTSGKVNFTLYMESLCPDCKNFFKTQLGPVWRKVGDIMNLVLVPYGNAREEEVQTQWKFTCQHGVQECMGNILETCAIHIYPEQKEHVPFIDCIEEMDFQRDVNITDVAVKCAKMHELDFDKMEKCAWSPWGNLLEHKMAEKTEALRPPHKYVPWVTLNGVHTDQIQEAAQKDLLKLICDTYRGEKPQACGERELPKHSMA